jgi:hypothetical protein
MAGSGAGLQWVDFDARQPGLGEGCLQTPVIGAGGLEDHAGGLPGRDPGDQRSMASLIVSELPAAAFGVNGDLEMVL